MDTRMTTKKQPGIDVLLDELESDTVVPGSKQARSTIAIRVQQARIEELEDIREGWFSTEGERDYVAGVEGRATEKELKATIVERDARIEKLETSLAAAFHVDAVTTLQITIAEQADTIEGLNADVEYVRARGRAAQDATIKRLEFANNGYCTSCGASAAPHVAFCQIANALARGTR